jgi:hypothetical protein
VCCVRLTLEVMSTALTGCRRCLVPQLKSSEPYPMREHVATALGSVFLVSLYMYAHGTLIRFHKAWSAFSGFNILESNYLIS